MHILITSAGAVAPLLCGCAGAPRGAAPGGSEDPFASRDPFASIHAPVARPGGRIDPDQVRSEVMSLADNYVQTVVQSLDGLAASTKDPRKAAWARKDRVATVGMSTANATEPNAVLGLLDMAVFASLKREAVEDHWVPTLLGEEGRPVVEAHRRGEAQAWATAGRVLTPAQVQQLRDLMDELKRRHPGKYYAEYARFSDFDVYRSLSPESAEAKQAGSLFSLLFVDPLAGLDPMARLVRTYRESTERTLYGMVRKSVAFAGQTDLAVGDFREGALMRTTVTGAEKAASVWDRLAQQIADFPKAQSARREAALKKVADTTASKRQAAIDKAVLAAAAKRKAIVANVEALDARVRTTVGNVAAQVERAERTARTVNTATIQKIAATEQATRQAADRLFRRFVVLCLVLLVGVPVILLSYHATRRRLLRRRGARRSASLPEHAPETGRGLTGSVAREKS